MPWFRFARSGGRYAYVEAPDMAEAMSRYSEVNGTNGVVHATHHAGSRAPFPDIKELTRGEYAELEAALARDKRPRAHSWFYTP